MSDEDPRSKDVRWGRFRFGVIGSLLSSPPAHGELETEIQKLAKRMWRHPFSGEWMTAGASTISKWYYSAKGSEDPITELSRQIREDSGKTRAISAELIRELLQQYEYHSSWSYQLHSDNLAVVAMKDVKFGSPPSYSTVRRFMISRGLTKKAKPKTDTPAALEAASRLDQLEVRSWEVTHVNALWHYDFHIGSLQVLLPNGEWHFPHCFCCLDDHSRLACHMQWYLTESAETVAHGLSQGFMKRGLPRGSLSDRGKAMIAAETQTGLKDLGINLQTTLAYSPYQNGKQEAFWNQAEGRLLAMLEGVKILTLDLLNEATQAWVELEYNRAIHSELGVTPIQRYLEGPDVGRSCTSTERLRNVFTRKVDRQQRKSDGTLTLETVRFEVPSRFRHMKEMHLRYAKWDLSYVLLVDDRTDTVLGRLVPLDKAANADGRRRQRHDAPALVKGPPKKPGIAPLLGQLMDEYRASGFPPGYLPKTSYGPDYDEVTPDEVILDEDGDKDE